MSSYFIPSATIRREIEVKRSRFIATLLRVRDRLDAEQQLQILRAEFNDATHNCFAYIAGAPANTADVACSDDGEVAGTAGRPLLNLLQHSDLGDVLLVVTRYYGGTLLGTGGLVRAYSDAAKQVLDGVARELKQQFILLEIITDYAFESAVRHAISVLDGQVSSAQFGERVTLLVQLSDERISALSATLSNITRGTVSFRQVDE